MRTASAVLTLAVGLLALLALLSWLLDLGVFRHGFSTHTTMKANTAVCLLLAAAAARLLARSSPSTGERSVALVLAATVAAIATATLAEYLLGWSLGIDGLLFNGAREAGVNSPPGRMAPNTAASLLMLGTALLAWDAGLGRFTVANPLTVAAGAVGLLGLIGYVTEVHSLYGVGTYTAMAPQTAIAILTLAAAILLARPTLGGMTLLVSDSYGGALARRLLPIALALPILVRALRLAGQHAGLFGYPLGDWLVATVMIAALTTLVLTMARWLDRIDGERSHAVETVHELTRHANDAIVSTDNAARITIFNPAAERMFGYTAEEAIGMPVARLMPQRLRAQHHASFNRVAGGGRPRLVGSSSERTGLRKDGVEFAIELSLSSQGSGDDLTFTAIIRDITERKRQETVLREAEERFRTTFDNAPVGMAIVSPEKENVGRLLHVNDALCRIVGRSRHELLAMTFAEITHPADLPADEVELQRTLSGESDGFERQKRFIHGDGHVVYAQVSVAVLREEGGAPIRLVAHIADVSERRHFEQAIQSSERRYRALAAAAPVGIFETDAQGRCTYTNERWCELAGVDPEAPLGDGWRRSIHPDDLERLTESWVEASRKGREFELEHRYLRPDGKTVWVAGRAIAVRADDGGISGFVGTVSDITELKAAQAKLAHLATHDELTGLPNRRHFNEELRRHLERGARYGWRGAMLSIDLDGLKQVNDALGHSAGDDLIHEAGIQLRRRLRKTDFLARFGGDEFAAILAEADAAEAGSVAADLVATMARRKILIHGEPTGTVSVGVVIVDDAVRGDELMIRADLALYAAKAEGRSRFAVYEPSMDRDRGGSQREPFRSLLETPVGPATPD